MKFGAEAARKSSAASRAPESTQRLAVSSAFGGSPFVQYVYIEVNTFSIETSLCLNLLDPFVKIFTVEERGYMPECVQSVCQ